MPKSQKILRLKDVAAILEVSTATVSNAFNRPSQLSRNLREHILARCHEIGYPGPNAAARSLRTGKTGIIGVMLSNYLSYSFSDAVANEFLQGLAEVFEERQYNLLVMPSRDHVEMASGYEAFVDGFIVYGPPQPQKLSQLVNQHKSIITVDFAIDGYVSVNVDNFKAAKVCAEHALQELESDDVVAILGLRINDRNHVCKVDDGGLFDEATITIQRLRGFQAAAKKAHKTIQHKLIWHVPDNAHKLAYQAANEALTMPKRPRVLLCMSDRIAHGALQAARHLGLRVPEDVKITGFDGIPESQTQHPTLTTVHQQSKDKGKIAAEIFLGMREEKSLVLPTELVVRESCP